ncbi:MAG: hypothetical protein DRJ61_02700 [Acidobacteria bacterium]|nr:MAG: hypothetical protein DRJ61_02700 [Acidobacteriota bacterium]
MHQAHFIFYVDDQANCPGRVITTERLRLRPFSLDDAPEVQRLAGAREIADTTSVAIRPPAPYSRTRACAMKAPGGSTLRGGGGGRISSCMGCWLRIDEPVNVQL